LATIKEHKTPHLQAIQHNTPGQQKIQVLTKNGPFWAHFSVKVKELIGLFFLEKEKKMPTVQAEFFLVF
jgi:hypothetical protein